MPTPKIFPFRGNLWIPSSAQTLREEDLAGWVPIQKIPDSDPQPKTGDVYFARVLTVGQHRELETKDGRILTNVTPRNTMLVTLGSRYATQYWAGDVPKEIPADNTLHLLNRSAIAGLVNEETRHVKTSPPTEIELLGRVYDTESNPVSTYNTHVLEKLDTPTPAKKILVVGSDMDSGKSTAAQAICQALNQFGLSVSGLKLGGVASLQDPQGMQNQGAQNHGDFTLLGHPSTSGLPHSEMVNIYETLISHYGQDPDGFVVMEIGDGLAQEQTSALTTHLLENKLVDKFVLCTTGTLDTFGALDHLERHNLPIPDIISGSSTASQLQIKQTRTAYKTSYGKDLSIPLVPTYQADNPLTILNDLGITEGINLEEFVRTHAGDPTLVEEVADTYLNQNNNKTSLKNVSTALIDLTQQIISQGTQELGKHLRNGR